MQPICLDCGVEMLNKPAKVRVIVEEVEGKPYKIFYATVKVCPNCHYEIAEDYDPAPIINHEEIEEIIDSSTIIVESDEYLVLE